MTQKKAAWPLNQKTTSEPQPVFVPPWLSDLNRPQRQDLYAQYRAATDSKKLKALAAITAMGLGGYGAAYIHGKNKMTRELAPEKPQPGGIPVNPEDLGSAEKTSNIMIDAKPNRSVFGDAKDLVSKAVSGATDSGISRGVFANPSAVWGLGVGVPALGIGTMAYKNLIDKLYKPPTEGQKELEQAQQEFNALLAQDHGAIKESNLRKTDSFIEAFEDRVNLIKQSNVYASWLPAIAALSALGAGYGTANYLGKTDPDMIRNKAAKEAMKRLRASQPPRLQAVTVDSPEEYSEMASLDNVDRNVIPVLKKKLADKGSGRSGDFFSKMGADMSAGQLAAAIQQMSQKNPEAINGLIDHLKKNNPDALKALGGADIDNNQLTGNLVNMLSGTGMISGAKANYAKNQILSNVKSLPPEYQKAMAPLLGNAPTQGPGEQNQPSMTSQIQPWQVGAAAASAGIGAATNHKVLGLAGAGAALYGPQMWNKYVESRQTSDPARATAWMKGDNASQPSPYMLPSKPVTARPTGALGTAITTGKNAIATVGRGVKNTAVDIKRGAGNLAWRMYQPAYQAVQDTFTRPPANKRGASSVYDLGHMKDL